jgi:hypothetical protein
LEFKGGPMGFYDDMAAVADEVMAEFQQGTVVLRRTVLGASDPLTPWIPGTPTPTDYPLKAAVKGVSQQYVDGTTVLSSDEQVTCSVPAVTPDMSTDSLLIDGVAVTVVKNFAIPAAGTPVAYRFIVRR